MENWSLITLGDYITCNDENINKSYPFKEILYLDTGSITCNSISELKVFEIDKAPSRARRLVKNDDIIYSTVRPDQFHYGYITDPPENLVVSTGFVVIRTNQNKLNSKFLYYYISSKEQTEYLHQLAEASTSAYPSLKPSDIESLELKVPPLAEQKAIAEVLSSLDDKIDLLHRQNETLEEMAQTLFRQWFVEEAEDSWEEKSLSNIATFLNGLACQKHPPKNEVDRLPVLKIRELRNGITESSDWASTDIDKKYLVQNGDVVFSWSASLLIKIWDGEDCFLNQHLFKVTSEEFPKWFYYLWSKFHLDQFIAIAKAHATTMGHIRRSDLDEAMVFIPTVTEIREMSKTFEPLIDKIITNNRQLKTLEKLRDTLLPKLMSGEVRVKL